MESIDRPEDFPLRLGLVVQMDGYLATLIRVIPQGKVGNYVLEFASKDDYNVITRVNCTYV